MVEYSVVSTRVTILGIALPVVIPILILNGIGRRPTKANWFNILAGIALMVGPVIYFLWSKSSPTEQAFDPGRLALINVVLFGAGAAGGLLLGIGIPRASTTVMSESAEDAGNTSVQLRILLTLMYVAYACFALFYSLGYSSEAGEIDAMHSLEESPRARVEVASASKHFVRSVCPEETRGCPFNVVLIGSRFTYLLPSSAERPMAMDDLYAIPTLDIRLIVYVDRE